MPVPNISYLYGSAAGTGIYMPTGGSATGRAAILALNPFVGQITLTGIARLVLNGEGGLTGQIVASTDWYWKHSADTSGYSGASAGGSVTWFWPDGIAPDATSTSTRVPYGGPSYYPVAPVHDPNLWPHLGMIPGPGVWEAGAYFSAGAEGGPGSDDEGTWDPCARIYLTPPPLPAGYYFDGLWDPWPIATFGSGGGGGVRLDSFGRLTTATVINVPNEGSPPGIQWRLQRCDLKPRTEERG